MPENFVSDVRTQVLLCIWQAILQASSKVEERTWAGKIHNIFLSPFVVRREPIPNVFAREAAFQVSNPYDIVEKAPEAFIAIQMTSLDYEVFASLKVSDFYTLNWKHNVDSSLVSIRSYYAKVTLPFLFD